MTVVTTSADALRAAYNQLYARYTLKESAEYYAWIARMLDVRPDETVVDVGCGAGLLLAALNRQGAERAIGFDFSERALHLARHGLARAPVCVAEAEHVPFASTTFDCVVCLGSLEHFADPDAALREMARLVRPEGRLLIVVPNRYFILDVLNAWWRGAGTSHGQPLERFAALREWRALLEAHGFRIKAVRKYNAGSAFSRAVFRVVWSVARPFIPLTMSYQFVFMCQLRPAPGLGL